MITQVQRPPSSIIDRLLSRLGTMISNIIINWIYRKWLVDFSNKLIVQRTSYFLDYHSWSSSRVKPTWIINRRNEYNYFRRALVYVRFSFYKWEGIEDDRSVKDTKSTCMRLHYRIYISELRIPDLVSYDRSLFNSGGFKGQRSNDQSA